MRRDPDRFHREAVRITETHSDGRGYLRLCLPYPVATPHTALDHDRSWRAPARAMNRRSTASFCSLLGHLVAAVFSAWAIELVTHVSVGGDHGPAGCDHPIRGRPEAGHISKDIEKYIPRYIDHLYGLPHTMDKLSEGPLPLPTRQRVTLLPRPPAQPAPADPGRTTL